MKDWLRRKMRSIGAFDDMKKRRPTRHGYSTGDGAGDVDDSPDHGDVLGVGEGRGSAQYGITCAWDGVMTTARMTKIRRNGYAESSCLYSDFMSHVRRLDCLTQ